MVAPNDKGVFEGAEFVDGIRCVHPVQAYLDLKDHPERAAEAAEELRRRIILRGDGYGTEQLGFVRRTCLSTVESQEVV